MKNKRKILIIVLLFMIFFTTGCTKYMRKEDKSGKKSVVINEKTGQSLTANILCKPTEKEVTKLYEKNEKLMMVKLKNLPTCNKFKPSDLKYTSLWESFFIKPLAFIILKIGNLVKSYGIAVMIVGLLIRVLLMPLSKKAILQSENMKKAQPELNRIEKKYKNKTDNESMMAKSQEMMIVYKKYGMNPISGCLVSFLQLPLFFAFLETINRIPAVFEETLLGLQLGTTPLKGISGHNYLYLILIILIILTTYFSFKTSMGTVADDKDNPAIKQTQFMTKFMLVFIAIASLSLPAAIALYWIVTNAFAVIQTKILKRKKK